jgi:uncharacterized membrane protein YeaQ/YmgE (transglycosylase-associated protein family)
MGATIAVRLPWPGKNQAGFLVHPGLVSRLGHLQGRWFKGAVLERITDTEMAGRRLPHIWQRGTDAGRSVAVMGIVSLLILGLLAGALAKWLLPGDDPGGVLVTMLIGVVGALLGGFLAGALFGADPLGGFFELSTWVTAVAGSIVLLLLYRMITRRRRTV